MGRPPPRLYIDSNPPAFIGLKPRIIRKLLCMARLLYCIEEALTAWWRIGLSNKYGRLVSACRRLMAFRVSQNMLIEGHNIHYKGHSNLNVA